MNPSQIYCLTNFLNIASLFSMQILLGPRLNARLDLADLVQLPNILGIIVFFKGKIGPTHSVDFQWWLPPGLLWLRVLVLLYSRVLIQRSYLSDPSSSGPIAQY